ncbi:MAG TPA: ABC transporter permease [Blastocatellia bacterium]|jgi:putative ABC transport system permease protein|nr:ABC transporter permease [Blastocatellia bacterium]
MLRKLFHRLGSSLRRGKIEREIDRELQFHLEMEAAENMRRGMNEEDARRAALLSFGGIERTKEDYRDIARFRRLEEFWQDLRYGARMLLRTPGFTLVAVLALALGIGANTAIFSVVNSMLLRPMPYYDPQRLVWVAEVMRHGDEIYGAADYIHWREQSKSFDHLVAFASGNIYLTGRGEPEQLDSIRATANLFPALGVTPQLGRTFTPEEDRPGAAPVVILSHAFWQRRFGGDPAIIGQSLTLDGISRQVIGVTPPGFKFIRKADVLLPHALNVQQELANQGISFLGNIIGRLKPGVTPEQARSELDAILRRIEETSPRRTIFAERATVTPLGERLFGDLRLGLLAQFGAVAFILLIACANVANLLLARASARQKELAIRVAMGAGRGRLVRQMLTESLLLSVCGGAAGLLLATLGVKALAPLTPADLAHLKASGVDGAALGFTFLVSLLTGVMAGVIPALQASRIDLNENLKEGARSAVFSIRARARRASPALVVGELALTLALLAGAGLLIKSFLRVRAVEPGFNSENLLTMTIPLYTTRYPLAQRKIFYQDLITRINGLPGVKVAAIGPLPLTETRTFVAPSSEAKAEKKQPTHTNFVGVDYFRAMGMQLRAGRSFTEQDNENAPRVFVINETLARQFAGEDPIGKRFRIGEQREATVIGVVADVKRYGLESQAVSEEYHSILQNAEVMGGNIRLVVRAASDPLKLAPAVRQQVWAINANVPVVDVMTMERRVAESVAPRRFQMLLFGAFAALALALAAVGVYGVISHSVSRRTHEIGVRMALGARPRNVLLMVIRQGMSFALAGVAIGLAASVALTRVMAGLLFNVEATDPATFACVSLLLVGVAFLAAYLPARRATKVDPMVALRYE